MNFSIIFYNFVSDIEKVLIFDGGFGGELNKLNLPLGTINEELNITNSEAIKTIHKNYVSSGSDFISTNTFGANRLKLKNSKYSLKSSSHFCLYSSLVNSLW